MRWLRRALAVVSLACLFVAWELITRTCHGCHSEFTGTVGAVRALVLAFVAGGVATLSIITGARRSATTLILLATCTFLVAGAQLLRLR